MTRAASLPALMPPRLPIATSLSLHWVLCSTMPVQRCTAITRSHSGPQCAAEKTSERRFTAMDSDYYASIHSFALLGLQSC